MTSRSTQDGHTREGGGGGGGWGGEGSPDKMQSNPTPSCIIAKAIQYHAAT